MKTTIRKIFIALLCVPAVLSAQTPIKSIKVAGDITEKDLGNANWAKAQAVTVAVMPQNIAPPIVTEPTISEVNVKSINNGTKIAFLLEWKDASRDAMVETDIFTDQVAIQMPINPANNPSFMMGNAEGGRVHIIHWKAIWQDDIEKGYRDVKDAHPNYWTDMYYFSDAKEGQWATKTTVNDIKSPQGKNYMPGAYAGNPMSIFDRKLPVEEAMAEGYGSLTTQEQQDATAWGVYENGSWKVLITKPLTTPDKNDAQLKDKTQIGLAVWDGKAKQRGGRKHYSMWTDLQIMK